MVTGYICAIMLGLLWAYLAATHLKQSVPYSRTTTRRYLIHFNPLAPGLRLGMVINYREGGGVLKTGGPVQVKFYPY